MGRSRAVLLADKAYNDTAIRALADDPVAWADIPALRTRNDSFIFDKGLYR